MEKRICPHCFTRWYSANYSAKYWICPTCGTKIPKPDDKSDNQEDDNND